MMTGGGRALLDGSGTGVVANLEDSLPGQVTGYSATVTTVGSSHRRILAFGTFLLLTRSGPVVLNEPIRQVAIEAAAGQ
jgi:hypothetical protein